MSNRVLAILSFHKIGDPPRGAPSTWFYITEDVFIGQLTYLRDHNWTVINAETFLQGLLDADRLPVRSALLTFDDGYRSLHGVTVSGLKRFGYPGVVFVPADLIGGSNEFDRDVEPFEPICDWEELRDLERAGVSVQSHGASHRRFSELSPAARRRELISSKASLEERLNKKVELFAYPYGDFGGDLEQAGIELESAGYRAGFLYKGQPVRLPADNPFALPRLAMGPDTELAVLLDQK